MHIPIWLILVAVVLGFIFLTPARQIMIDFFATAWNFICYAAGRLWDFFRGAAPAAGVVALTAGVIIGRVLMFVALAIILITTVAYFTLGAGIMTVGIIIGHWKAALFLLLFSASWGFFSVFPAFWVFKPLRNVSKYIMRPIVIFLTAYLMGCSIWWGFGQIAPELQASIERYWGNQTTEVVDNLDNASVKTEGKTGNVGRIDEDNVFGYNMAEGVLVSAPISKGTYVRLVTEYSGGKLSKPSEGMLWVMLANANGDFVGGALWMVPPRKINWDWNKPEPVVTAAPQITPEVKTVVPVQQTVSLGNYLMETEDLGKTFRHQAALCQLDDKGIRIIQVWPNGHKITYIGHKEGNVFRGVYRHIEEGQEVGGFFYFDPEKMEGGASQPGERYARFWLYKA